MVDRPPVLLQQLHEVLAQHTGKIQPIGCLVKPSAAWRGRRPGGSAPASECPGDRPAQFVGGRGAAHVAGAGTVPQDGFDGRHDGAGRIPVAEVIKHHGTRPDLADGIRDPPAVDVRRRAVHRLEARWVFPLGVEVGRRRDANRTGHSRPKVREDVAEEVRSHHHVEPLRVQDELRREDVDVILVRPDLGVLRAHGPEALVPVRHGDGDAVGLGGGRDMPLGARHGQFEGVAQNAVDAAAREDTLLHGHFLLGALVTAPADRRILAFAVLAHDPEVDVAGLLVGERAGHAGHEPHGPQVDVLLEAAADRDQQTPE